MFLHFPPSIIFDIFSLYEDKTFQSVDSIIAAKISGAVGVCSCINNEEAQDNSHSSVSCKLGERKLNSKLSHIPINSGEVSSNTKDVVLGSAETEPLNETGVMQAQALALHLAERGTKVSEIHCSKFRRAFQTAKIIAKGLGLNEESHVICVEELRERVCAFPASRDILVFHFFRFLELRRLGRPTD